MEGRVQAQAIGFKHLAPEITECSIQSFSEPYPWNLIFSESHFYLILPVDIMHNLPVSYLIIFDNSNIKKLTVVASDVYLIHGGQGYHLGVGEIGF